METFGINQIISIYEDIYEDSWNKVNDMYYLKKYCKSREGILLKRNDGYIIARTYSGWNSAHFEYPHGSIIRKKLFYDYRGLYFFLLQFP